MKRTLSRSAIALAVVLLFASCTTISLSSDEGGAAYVSGLVNGKRASRLVAISASPFLVDGEIIALRDDLATFWNGYVQAGLAFDPDRSQAAPVDADTWRKFGSTRDLRLFFGRLAEEGARVFDFVTADGRHVFVLYRTHEGKPVLYGIKGPF